MDQLPEEVVKSIRVHEPVIDPKKKQPTPADLVRERVEEARRFGIEKGFGKIKSDKYIDGIGIYIVYESGATYTIQMPPGSRT
jgi:hypothetical protein